MDSDCTDSFVETKISTKVGSIDRRKRYKEDKTKTKERMKKYQQKKKAALFRDLQFRTKE